MWLQQKLVTGKYKLIYVKYREAFSGFIIVNTIYYYKSV